MNFGIQQFTKKEIQEKKKASKAPSQEPSLSVENVKRTTTRAMDMWTSHYPTTEYMSFIR